ncbi:hypothetical protein GPJ56_003946 [Histomonas meleagridis]|uniref:uncharacterized protein n=1 Tax=Histomonas meleagridis TaxID=135588 RepID=UPI00355A2212|nr:hypothetical protein GPJ56_003946 [Histomonas meleagridis]KAH0798119.1 hypothetical protein GO595_009130 [Histomonas meleagridis]
MFKNVCYRAFWLTCDAKYEMMERLLELGAILEQISKNSPIQTEIALLALEGIRNMIVSHRSEPFIPNEQMNPKQQPKRVPPPQQQLMPIAQQSQNMQIPQIQIQPEPIMEFDNTTFVDMPQNSGIGVSGSTEIICFDDLDSTQFNQIQNIPFLYHN